jgi:hypothetical protein
MQNIQLNITLDNLNGLISILGDLPTKTGVFPLIQDFKQQAEAQIKISAEVADKQTE